MNLMEFKKLLVSDRFMSWSILPLVSVTNTFKRRPNLHYLQVRIQDFLWEGTNSLSFLFSEKSYGIKEILDYIDAFWIRHCSSDGANKLSSYRFFK